MAAAIDSSPRREMGPVMVAPDSAIHIKRRIILSPLCMIGKLTAEVVFAVLVCIGTGFTGFRTSGVGRLISKVATIRLGLESNLPRWHKLDYSAYPGP